MWFLIYFILGVLFYSIIIPIIESIVSLIETAIEVRKYKMSVKIAEYTKQIKDFGEDNEIASNVIGFSIDNQEDCYDEEEEEEE